jgi:hypothetical protein
MPAAPDPIFAAIDEFQRADATEKYCAMASAIDNATRGMSGLEP